MKRLALGVSTIAILFSGCATTGGSGGGAAIGGILGAGGCALLGGSTAECALAAVAGAAAGYALSEYLDERDREAYAEAQAKAASTGEAVTVFAPETGNQISFTPTSTFANAEGKTCRTFDASYTREGTKYPAKETVCELSPGNWQPVEA